MTTRPTTIEGGCLCGGVRFKVNFAEDHDWKRGPHTCQCTQCRKNCGSLVYHMHTVAASELIWLSKSTYAEYKSSPGCVRAFCKNCGSSLLWQELKENAELELAVGTFDEEYLLGNRDLEDKPTGGYVESLANPAGDHFYLRNEIKGITDQISASGTRFSKGSKEGPMR